MIDDEVKDAREALFMAAQTMARVLLERLRQQEPDVLREADRRVQAGAGMALTIDPGTGAVDLLLKDDKAMVPIAGLEGDEDAGEAVWAEALH